MSTPPSAMEVAALHFVRKATAMTWSGLRLFLASTTATLFGGGTAVGAQSALDGFNSSPTNGPFSHSAAAMREGTMFKVPWEETFSVFLPKLNDPPDDPDEIAAGVHWVRPPVWGNTTGVINETIQVPKGRPIYALIVSGYGQNGYLDQLMVYRFARHLMAQDAYVHFAWWNNLLAPYMEKPLHHPQSYPGNLGQDFTAFLTAKAAGGKALPGEDYQFVEDAKRFLLAIRENNPSAMIIVVGHSMGGSAIAHLASQPEIRANVLIDLLAPIDPVNNRNYPFAGTRTNQQDYNWTRWRVTRGTFLGYKQATFVVGSGCVPTGEWLKDVNEVSTPPLCTQQPFFVHEAARLEFGPHVVNLHYRYQTEAKFPFDFPDVYRFNHVIPPGGGTGGNETDETITAAGGTEVGGWPQNGNKNTEGCCANFSNGTGWPMDGHGEVVGYRGPVPDPVPLAVRVRTSAECGSNCPSLNWPGRTQTGGVWSNTRSAERVDALEELEGLRPASAFWSPHEPRNPSLCLVSQGLINRFNAINKPPVANAGPDEKVECQGPHGAVITLDGTASTDPDPNDRLTYTWDFGGQVFYGRVVTVIVPFGEHSVTLTVRDPPGHIARTVKTITVLEDPGCKE